MNTHATLNRVWPLVLVLAAIALLMHATQSASGAEPCHCDKCAASGALNCVPRTWCEGCPKPKCSPCDEYCRKSAPCVKGRIECGDCPDYCRKCAPKPPCRARLVCDDYCRKPCPVCPPCGPASPVPAR